ncbi:MAG TPA: hypothetical protein VME43_07630 [Bryobacteraceae bacterium]|nr:hypothetical protein [Bryobacteraceae bacterium]
MLFKRYGLALVALACVALAQSDARGFLKLRHDREDQSWALKSGLAVTDVRAMRVIAGISDDTFAWIIDLDAKSLRKNNHVLLVQRANLCVTLHVFEHTSADFKEVWSLSEMPSRTWIQNEIGTGPGHGICSQAPRAPTAHATPDGRIVLEVPFLLDPSERTLPTSTYSFAWDGKKYALVEEHR